MSANSVLDSVASSFLRGVCQADGTIYDFFLEEEEEEEDEEEEGGRWFLEGKPGKKHRREAQFFQKITRMLDHASTYNTVDFQF